MCYSVAGFLVAQNEIKIYVELLPSGDVVAFLLGVARQNPEK